MDPNQAHTIADQLADLRNHIQNTCRANHDTFRMFASQYGMDPVTLPTVPQFQLPSPNLRDQIALAREDVLKHSHALHDAFRMFASHWGMDPTALPTFPRFQMPNSSLLNQVALLMEGNRACSQAILDSFCMFAVHIATGNAAAAAAAHGDNDVEVSGVTEEGGDTEDENVSKEGGATAQGGHGAAAVDVEEAKSETECDILLQG